MLRERTDGYKSLRPRDVVEIVIVWLAIIVIAYGIFRAAGWETAIFWVVMVAFSFALGPSLMLYQFVWGMHDDMRRERLERQAAERVVEYRREARESDYAKGRFDEVRGGWHITYEYHTNPHGWWCYIESPVLCHAGRTWCWGWKRSRVSWDEVHAEVDSLLTRAQRETVEQIADQVDRGAISTERYFTIDNDSFGGISLTGEWVRTHGDMVLKRFLQTGNSPAIVRYGLPDTYGLHQLGDDLVREFT